MDTIKWEQLTKRTDDPKLAHLEHILTEAGIQHRRNGSSFHAPILEVPADSLDQAWAMLSRPAKSYGLRCRGSYDLVRDDHPQVSGYAPSDFVEDEYYEEDDPRAMGWIGADGRP